MSTTAQTAATEEMPGDGVTSTEIAERGAITEHAVSVMPLMSDGEIHRAWRIASALARSRMFKDTHQAEQAFAKILIGRDLGISPTQSMMTIDLVRGNVQLRGVLLASFVRKHADYDYKVVESTHTKAKVLFLSDPVEDEEEGYFRHRGRWWYVLGESEFTIEDAERAKLVKTDGGWATHPKNMCVWRAVSNGVKFHTPDLLAGIPVYVEGELDNVPSTTAYSDAARPAGDTDTVVLPEELEQLVARAHAIDPKTWRHAEVAARLPEEGAEGYHATLESLVGEIRSWLAENDPPEADVVEDDDAVDVDVDADADPEPEPETSGNERVDITAKLQERWTSDSEWRAMVGPLLSQHADIDAALDEAVGENDEHRAAQLREELKGVEEALDGLECPVGWVPESDDSPS